MVTGGAGFIGSHLAEALLDRGDEVVIIDDLSAGKRDQVPRAATLVTADVRNPLDQVFEDFRPQACFHLAAHIDLRAAVEDPAHDAEVNVLGTIRVLEAAGPHGCVVVLASTGGAIYGECERPAKETAPLRPMSPYGVSKLAAEEYLAMYNRLHGTYHASLRFGNVYGPRQDPHGEAGVVAIFFRALAEGKRPQIFGNGKQTRDFIAVSDVIRATLASAGKRGVFNIGTGIETSVLQLVELCGRIVGGKAEPRFLPPRRGELMRSVLDPSLAFEEFDWRPERGLEQGLRETWEWVRASGVTGEAGEALYGSHGQV